jgi:nucleotide-binding universal stress UspA family protein
VINVRNILYATDFSPYSNQAYFHAVALAESHGASLTVAHVYAPGPSALESATEDAGREHWREQLRQIRPLNPHIPVRHVFLEGDPAAEILRYAADAGVDLIVMGTHGRTGLDRLLLGSVAEKVLRGASRSVLVVKMPKPAPAAKELETVGPFVAQGSRVPGG